jgi:UDP-N-acetylglucosamine 4,6-dehydratase
MTRFWITLDQSVHFVLKVLELASGGEIFVPKIPSINIADLAAAMAPSRPTKIVGIRPGEKLHEIMCPADDSHLTLEFSDHYVIQPAIKFYHKEHGYKINNIKEIGNTVTQGFEYSSGKNEHFLSIDEISEFNRIAETT